jgi:hypothetical protein
VVVVAVLVELATPEVSLALPLAVLPDVEPDAPIELVLPDVLPLPLPVAGDVLALMLPEVSLPAVVPPLVLPPMALVLLGVVLPVAGVVVLDELVDVDGEVPASSRLVQAPRETAAIRASAAHEVRDAFIGRLLEELLNREGQPAPPRATTLRARLRALVGLCRREM